jgi:hypothetical protein
VGIVVTVDTGVDVQIVDTHNLVVEAAVVPCVIHGGILSAGDVSHTDKRTFDVLRIAFITHAFEVIRVVVFAVI